MHPEETGSGSLPTPARVEFRHPVQRALSAEAYRAMLAEAISDEDLAAIRLYLQQQRA